MKNLNAVAACTVAVVFAGCGGGGDSSGGASADNPLRKYEGTYYHCDDHDKVSVTVVAAGSNSVTLSYTEQIYQNANCTGSIVGTYTLPQAITASFQSQTTANLPPVTVLPSAGTVDKITVSAPNMTAQLTGTGVKGSCVYFSSGNTCFDSLDLPAQTTTGALHLSGNYLVVFTLSNGVLESDSIYSKDPAFNYNILATD